MRRYMTCRPTSVFITVFLAVACGCAVPPGYKQPPARTYTTGTRQAKLGNAVTSVQGATGTLDFFRAAEVRPLLGRFFIDGDQVSPAPRVVVLSHDLWTERFASSPTIIGQSIELDGRQATVGGIAPPGFRFPEGTVLWTPKDAR